MCIAAAEELARCAEEKGISEERILPTMDDRELYPREAAAVALKAIEQGVAQKSLTKSELIATANKIIDRAKRQTQVLMEEGVLAPSG
jgi:malate dehydrogenase (oxaloacetate-decarboxylating)